MAQAPTVSGVSNLESLLSRRAAGLPVGGRFNRNTGGEQRVSFVYGFPDPASLPAEQVAAATVRALAAGGRSALQYGAATGYRGLIDVLLQKLKRDQGIEAGPENVLITAGGSQAFALVLDALVDWGDPVVSEMPIWLGAVHAFRNVGARVVAVPVDEQGTDTDAVERELVRLRDAGTRAKLIYVVSTFQNPTGITTSLERRRRLIELTREHGTLLLEDDAYFDLRYAGESIPPIYALDDSGSTMYLGTLSKTVGAGMRLGWLVADPAIIGRLAALKIDGGTNIFGAHVAADWLPRHLEEHVGELRQVYGRRRDLMLAALERHMPVGSTWTRPDGGFFVWLTLPEGVDAERMLPQVQERGVDYLPGTTCYTDQRGQNQIRLSFSFAEDDRIDEGIRVIGEVARSELLEGGRG